MSFSNEFEIICLDLLFSETVYIGLKTADPTDDNSGGDEPVIDTGGYTRIESVPADWGPAAAGKIENSAILEFPESTDPWSTGATELTHFIIMDAASGGVMKAHGLLTTPRIVNAAGVLLRFPVGEIDVTLD